MATLTLLVTLVLVVLWLLLLVELLRRLIRQRKARKQERERQAAEALARAQRDKELAAAKIRELALAEARMQQELAERKRLLEKQDREERLRKEKEAAAAKARLELQRKTKLAVQIMNGNPLIAEYAAKLAELDEDCQLSPEAAGALIAAVLSAEAISILQVAALQQDIELDLQSRVVEERVLYPTNAIVPMPLSGVEQLHDSLPEQMMLEDENFYGQIAREELLIMQPYERHYIRKRLYILLDISNSMAEKMASGMPRHAWSCAIAMNLLAKAMTGEACYTLRRFAGTAYDASKVSEPAEAKAVMDNLMNSSANGNGTNILGALKTATGDIRQEKESGDTADILLITDGEHLVQFGEMTLEAVQTLLGEDIRLHVAAIAVESAVLKEAATTHKFFT